MALVATRCCAKGATRRVGKMLPVSYRAFVYRQLCGEVGCACRLRVAIRPKPEHDTTGVTNALEFAGAQATPGLAAGFAGEVG